MKQTDIDDIHNFVDQRAKDNQHINNKGRLAQRWNELFARGFNLTPEERKEKRQIERRFGIV